MSGSSCKRPHDQDSAESNGTGKHQKSRGHHMQHQALIVSSDGIVFRLLCPASKIDSMTGENGIFLSQISEETGSEVRVGQTTPGCDESIVFITRSKHEDDGKEDIRAEEGDDRKEHDAKGRDRKPAKIIGSKPGMDLSSLQKALVLVFQRLAEAEIETNGVGLENESPSPFGLRLLVPSSQVGCLLGKGGSLIKQMAGESGAQILILPRDKLPPCAAASDEIVQISGKVDAVRKALQSVSQLLLGSLQHDAESLPTSHEGPSSLSSGHPVHKSEVRREPNKSFSSERAPGVAGPRIFAGVPSRMMLSQEMLTFRLICPNERLGGVIGKGGAIIKTLQHDTGCEIKILDGFFGSQDRMIVISGPAHPDDRISPVQDATLRVLARIVRAVPDSKEKNVGARLLISSDQMACLLGKGGSVIAEMRTFSGAYIHIGSDQIPKGAFEGDEMVQINGKYEAVQEALLQITTRLQHHFFSGAFPSAHHPLRPVFFDAEPPFPPYMRRSEFSPSSTYSSFGPSRLKFDHLGGPPLHDGFFPHDGPPPFTPWNPQGLIEDGGLRRRPGFGGDSQPANVMNTTVEVVVPSYLVPVIYGEDGACLKQIRQFSDAKITIMDPKPGAAETVVLIYGTPEQTHAAQSLIQAFVLSETEAS